MADKPPSQDGSAAAKKAQRNPALQMMGLPRFSRIKLPSRNWMIFFSVVGSWTSALLYDRYHQRRAQRKWAEYVAPLAKEILPSNTVQRKITIFLAAPPNDSLREPREHFHEYIKPILVAGAIDWDVIEGRREGEVRAGLAEKIRKMRKRKGEQYSKSDKEEPDLSEAVIEVRGAMGIKEWDGVKGDLVIGRHTWKEYIRGQHEGWLGPMDPPASPIPLSTEETSSDVLVREGDSPLSSDTQEGQPAPILETPNETPKEEKPKPPTKPSPTPPYIEPPSYSASNLAPTMPLELPPSTAVHLPHILGFLNTPKRMYRFLNRRHIAESTGSEVAALVLAVQTRPYQLEYTAPSASGGAASDSTSVETRTVVDPTEKAQLVDEYSEHPAVRAEQERRIQKKLPSVDEMSPQTGVSDTEAPAQPPEYPSRPRLVWEQDKLLKEAEAEWHKSAWKENPEGEEKERPWKEEMVIDPRIDSRMRTFVLPEGAREQAEEVEEQRRKNELGYWEQAKRWAGYGPVEKKGWDMGLEPDPNESGG